MNEVKVVESVGLRSYNDVLEGLKSKGFSPCLEDTDRLWYTIVDAKHFKEFVKALDELTNITFSFYAGYGMGPDVISLRWEESNPHMFDLIKNGKAANRARTQPELDPSYEELKSVLNHYTDEYLKVTQPIIDDNKEKMQKIFGKSYRTNPISDPRLHAIMTNAVDGLGKVIPIEGIDETEFVKLKQLLLDGRELVVFETESGGEKVALGFIHNLFIKKDSLGGFHFSAYCVTNAQLCNGLESLDRKTFIANGLGEFTGRARQFYKLVPRYTSEDIENQSNLGFEVI